MYKKLTSIYFWIINTLTFALINPASVLAEEKKTEPPKIPQIDTLPRPDVENVSEVSRYLRTGFLPRVAITIVSIAIGASVIMLIFGSIQMLTAYGDTEKYSNSKKTVIFSLVGLIIALLSYAIVQFIFYTGYNIA